MKLDYYYRQTQKITENLEQLKVLVKVIELLPQLLHIEENLLRESLLKSSLFSARIEGNKLSLPDLRFISLEHKSSDVSKIEVANILHALHWVYTKSPKKISEATIFKLHQFVLNDISPNTGHLRREPSAIFNMAGVAIYLPPPPSDLPSLFQQLVSIINTSSEPGPIKAALSHFAFEKIHPFLDGNGRCGRLLSTLILKNSGFGFRGLVSSEEYLEEQRQTYYDLLALNQKDITAFVEFFLEGLKIQAEKTTDNIKNVKLEKPEDKLLPRRREILEIVKNQQMVSFDFLKRRFKKIPDSTLHYDLSQLMKEGFIKKLGTSRGVLYSPITMY